MTRSVPSLIGELDAIFQATADRLERQALDAELIDRALRRLLEQATDDPSVMEWDPRRPISPRNAFRALAMRIVGTIQSSSGRRVPISPSDYEDLLAWPDEPVRSGTPTEDFLSSIAFARQQSLQAFWDRLQLRVSPEHDPDRAIRQALEDLLDAFAIAQPRNLVVPVLQVPPQRALSMDLRRTDNDLPWVINAMQLQRLTRANHAIATVCVLDGKPDAAEAIHEATGRITQRLKANFAQYQPNTIHHAGRDVQLAFGRDTIAYRFRIPLYERVADTLSAHSADIQFIPAMSN